MVTAKFGIIRNGQTLRVILKFCEMLKLELSGDDTPRQCLTEIKGALSPGPNCHGIKGALSPGPNCHVMAIQFYAIKSAQSSSKIKI